MFFFCIFLLELVALFIFSQQLTKSLSHLLLRITRSQHTTIHVLAFLFLPGVILHEIAHLVVANILFVPTGEIEFFPQIQGDSVKLGSVAIAKTDPFRRFLIGVAPLIFGVGVLLTLFYFFSADFPALNWQTALLFYASFEIGNTMFSSKKDMEGSLVLLIGLVLFGIAFWILGLNISLENFYLFFNSAYVTELMQKAVMMMSIPLVLNILFLFTFTLFSRRTYH